jgi:hypothetical protein
MAALADTMLGMIETSELALHKESKGSLHLDMNKTCEAIARAPTCLLPATAYELAEAEKQRHLQQDLRRAYETSTKRGGQVTEKSIHRRMSAIAFKREAPKPATTNTSATNAAQGNGSPLLRSDPAAMPPMDVESFLVRRSSPYGELPWAGLKLLLKFLQRHVRYKTNPSGDYDKRYDILYYLHFNSAVIVPNNSRYY